MLKKLLGYGFFFQKEKALCIVLHVDFMAKHQLWQEKVIITKKYSNKLIKNFENFAGCDLAKIKYVQKVSRHFQCLDNVPT